MRVKATIEYLGTAYAGWQVQPNALTVQEVLERALETVLSEPCRIEGSGRTDSGVHAEGQVAAFDVPDGTDLRRLTASLNGLTPHDVSAVTLEPARADFDPRRHATSRTYRYVIVSGRPPSPFLRDRSWHVQAELQFDLLVRLAEAVMGEHDFSAFRASDCEAKTSVRHVTESRWRREGGLLVYEISANAFLKQMVRTLVGTMVDVAFGRIAEDAFYALLNGGLRRAAGRTAPARGLTLVRVEYPD